MSLDGTYGLMAEFGSAHALLGAARAARRAGFERLEAYSPFPVEGLAEALGFGRSAVPAWTLAGGVLGGLGGYVLQWYTAVIDYPLNIGGRPLHSWPSFIPITFETAVLGAALAAVVVMLFGNGLPRLRHPIFNAADFEQATRHRFFLCLRADDTRFDAAACREFLGGLRPLAVCEVPL